MAKFLTPLITRLDEEDEAFSILMSVFIYVADKPIEYLSGARSWVVRVPKGFRTNFASVPRLPFMYLFFGDVAKRAAVLHDYLYHYKLVSKAEADRIFLEAMKLSKIWPARRYPMYWAVKIAGHRNYNKIEEVLE